MVKKLTATATATATHVLLTVPTGTVFEKMTRYDICVTNPMPVYGLSVPMAIVVSGGTKLNQLVRNGLGDSVFGYNEKHSKCIVTYYNDQEKFVDLRVRENRPYCDCERNC